MKILGIDSSTDFLAVGLADGTKRLYQCIQRSPQEHASSIVRIIDTVLDAESMKTEDIEGIVVADGPGSFTGLRIGMAVAKGMARALNIPVVGVSTFEVLGRRLLEHYDDFYLAAMVRKGEFYLCRVREGSEIRKDIILIEQNLLPEKVGSKPTGIVGRMPEGWAKLIEKEIPREMTMVDALGLAQIGAELISNGKNSDPATSEPLYIAPSQAERKFGRK